MYLLVNVFRDLIVELIIDYNLRVFLCYLEALLVMLHGQ